MVNHLVEDFDEHKMVMTSKLAHLQSLVQYHSTNGSEDMSLLTRQVDLLQYKMNVNNYKMNNELTSIKVQVGNIIESMPPDLDSKLVMMNMSMSDDLDIIKNELQHVNEIIFDEVDRVHSRTLDRMNDNFTSLEGKIDTIDSKFTSVDSKLSELNDLVTGDFNDVKTELGSVSENTLELSAKINEHNSNISRKLFDTQYSADSWRRVVYLDMTDPTTNCPSGWQLTGYSKRSCGKVNTSRMSCDSVKFPVHGGPYNQVWGKIKGYQFGTPKAFRTGENIDNAYFSGIAVMHGNPRQHIWTFAVGSHENDSYHYRNCPCDTDRIRTMPTPEFVGNDYFCESGYVWPGELRRDQVYRFHSNDTLWDGKDCHLISRCCAFNNPPYFSKLLSQPTNDDLELRICNDHYISTGNTAVEFIELYVKQDYVQTKLQEIEGNMNNGFAHQTNNINNLHIHQCGNSGGWRRAVYFDMTDPNTDCPPGFTPTGLSKRTCTRSRSIEWTCDSAFFPISGGEYNQVCGSIKAYQFGLAQAFWGYRDGYSAIDNAYFDGVAVMHGSPRQHIWTFTAGAWENAWRIEPEGWNNCPCDNNYRSVPPFVGDDYFCESGYIHPGYRDWRLERRLHTNDTLWDGKDCLSTSTCCSLHNPPYFTKNLSQTTANDLELRMCDHESGNNIAIERVELYVKLDSDLQQQHPPASIPGRAFYDNSVHVHTCGGTEGWRRAVYLNITDPNTSCPSGWRLTGYTKRTCHGLSGRQGSCNSAFFPVEGGPYHHVCGRIRAYQWATPTAFSLSSSISTPEDPYFDGVAVMHGLRPRHHIWTFAAGSKENSTPGDQSNVCPCDKGSTFYTRPPPFVGEDYFCESGYIYPGYYDGEQENQLHVNDILWDGEDCHSTSTCCSHHNPPYFTKTLDQITNDDLELRTCTYGNPVAVELVELYVK